MKVARRIRYISAEGSPRVATVDMDQDIDAALSLMEAMGERTLQVDVLELEPRSLLEDIVAFLDMDPDARRARRQARGARALGRRLRPVQEGACRQHLRRRDVRQPLGAVALLARRARLAYAVSGSLLSAG